MIDESDDIAHRMRINYEKKLSIARAAKEFIREGETIFIESGSINALFAKEVSSINNVTIITCYVSVFENSGQEIDKWDPIAVFGGS